jgi:hypothetical protein
MKCRRKIDFEHYDNRKGWQFIEYCDHDDICHSLRGCQFVLSRMDIEDDNGNWVIVENKCPCEGYRP